MLEVHWPGGQTLSVLNAALGQLEAADGPLIGIRIDGTSNTLIIDDTAPKPTIFVKVQPASEAPPANSTVLFNARVYVAGQQVDCVAYRAKS
jgi:hypothetical protein